MNLCGTFDKRLNAACINCLLFFFPPNYSRLTCAFLACKVDEFNVSSSQFVGNLRESPLGQEKALEQILEYELLLIQQLNFHLIVHNPYRPFEGILIDLKVMLFYLLCTLYFNVIQIRILCFCFCAHEGIDSEVIGRKCLKGGVCCCGL